MKIAPGYFALSDAIRTNVQHSVIADLALPVGPTPKLSALHLQIYPNTEWRRRETETESILLDLSEPFLSSDVILT